MIRKKVYIWFKLLLLKIRSFLSFNIEQIRSKSHLILKRWRFQDRTSCVLQKWQHFLFNIRYVSHGLSDWNSFEHTWSIWSTWSSMHDHRMLADLKFKVAVFLRHPAVIFIHKLIKFAGILIQAQKKKLNSLTHFSTRGKNFSYSSVKAAFLNWI